MTIAPIVVGGRFWLALARSRRRDDGATLTKKWRQFKTLSQSFHDPQIIEGILGVEQIAFVNAAAVFLDIAPRQSGTTENDRHSDAPLIEDIQIFFHDH